MDHVSEGGAGEAPDPRQSVERPGECIAQVEGEVAERSEKGQRSQVHPGVMHALEDTDGTVEGPIWEAEPGRIHMA